RALNSSTGKRRSTRPSIRPALWSNASSPTSRPGEFSTPTTGDRWTRSTQQSPQLSGCSSTRWRELPLNKPPGRRGPIRVLPIVLLYATTGLIQAVAPLLVGERWKLFPVIDALVFFAI